VHAGKIKALRDSLKNATLYSERVLEVQIDHKMGELSIYGLFNSKNNTVNVAEIITLVTFVHMINFSWNIASRNKLNTGPITCQKFYRTTLWSEWLDCMLHIVLLGVLGNVNAPGLIYAGFSVAHVLASLFQV